MNTTPVEIFQYEYVRRSGITNMLDLKVVRETAEMTGFSELSEICQSEDKYFKLLLNFQLPDEDEYRKWRKNV
jgi:hypothetical protein